MAGPITDGRVRSGFMCNITGIFLKVALNTINPTLPSVIYYMYLFAITRSFPLFDLSFQGLLQLLYNSVLCCYVTFSSCQYT
jgi:hypothetical protein